MIIDSTEEYEKDFSGIKSEIETINDGKKNFMTKIMMELHLILMMIYF